MNYQITYKDPQHTASESGSAPCTIEDLVPESFKQGIAEAESGDLDDMFGADGVLNC